MTEIAYSRKLAWQTFTDLKISNAGIFRMFEDKGVYGAENLFHRMMPEIDRVWDTVPQKVRSEWATDSRFYRHLLEKFDYKQTPPVLKGRPLEVTWEILEELTPTTSMGLGR